MERRWRRRLAKPVSFRHSRILGKQEASTVLLRLLGFTERWFYWMVMVFAEEFQVTLWLPRLSMINRSGSIVLPVVEINGAEASVVAVPFTVALSLPMVSTMDVLFNLMVTCLAALSQEAVPPSALIMAVMGIKVLLLIMSGCVE